MADKQQTTIVGFFVLMGMVILGGLIMAFGGGRSLLVSTYELSVLFPQGVEGIQEGQAVTLNGKRIGETQALHFADETNLAKGVIVVVSVEGLELPAACEMRVWPNLMGLGKPPIALVVTDPTDERKIPMDGTGTISGTMLPRMDQLIPKDMQVTFQSAALHIGELADALRPAAANLGRLLEARSMDQVDTASVTANLDTLIQRIDTAMKAFNVVIGDPKNQENLSAVLANGRKMSEAGVTAMENVRDLSGEGKKVAADLSTLLQKLASATDDLSGVLKRLDQTVALMQDKTGTVGKMFTDDRLYEEMLLSAKRLTLMLDQMREVLDNVKKDGFRFKL